MEGSKENDEVKEEYVDSRNVKTIRSLRKSSAKKSIPSIKSEGVTPKESGKDFRISK